MNPRLDILPPAQRRLWPLLAKLPPHFVLYGGTGIAVRLGHRQSVDFDFFSDHPLTSDELLREIPFLAGALLVQAAPNTATFLVRQDAAEVRLSFFGSLSFGRVGTPEQCADNGLRIASLLDLAAQKMKVILSRAEAKDYLDIHALFQTGLTLPEALGAARALHREFNPLLSLKALTYYGEPTLAALSETVRVALTSASELVGAIPEVTRIADGIA